MIGQVHLLVNNKVSYVSTENIDLKYYTIFEVLADYTPQAC